MIIMKTFCGLVLAIFVLSFGLQAQDTTIVQTLTYDSTARAGVWAFPDDTSKHYEKILLQYSMRCHDGLVGNGAVGCREWDYHCNTVITDSSTYDSTRRTAPSHIIPNFSDTTFNVSFSPTYTYYDFTQYNVQYTSTLAETTAVLGSGNLGLAAPFTTSIPRTKTQYLWTAAELNSAGLTAGNLTGLRMDVSSLGANPDFLRINVKATAQLQLDPINPDISGFTEVYFLNTTFAGSGIHNFNFYNPFQWDGISNLIVEFSYKNNSSGLDNQVQGTSLMNMGIQSRKEDYFLELQGAGGVDLPTNSLSSLSSQVTLSFWAYGESSLPVNTTVFEGKDQAGNRQLNVHLPWGNGRVYWDCGNDGGGYDRIDYAADPNDFKGRWAHWAFTKNTTSGEMKIYVDGHLVHSGTGNTKLIDVMDFRFGGANISTLPYQGKLDEFRVWDVELDSTTIQNWMYRDLLPTHPNYSNLLGYYSFDTGTGSIATDASPNSAHGNVLAGTAWRELGVKDYWRNFSPLTERPNAIFVKGSYTQTTTSMTIRDSVVNAQNAVTEYSVNGTDLLQGNTTLYYQAGNQYVYDENGVIVDSVMTATDSTINLTTLTYYGKNPSRYEIVSFITPYGNGLDLGPDGVMWTIDVTDFLPILKGPKRMSIEGVGNYQEEMDLRFLFIEGIPPRDVISIQQLWPIMSESSVWYSNGLPSILNNNVFEPRSLILDPNADMFKIRSAITGHGQNGEFVARWHYVNINSGSQEFRWQVWKECAEMPVYPQGGTWLYDRAGWCPGMPTDVQHFSLDGLVNPGDSIEVDYGMDQISNTSDADYRIANQLVTYGAPNHQLDAAVVEVKRPSRRVEHARFNPACTEPSIIIRNAGSTQLNSLVITYQVRGGSSRTFNWSGNLGFLEEEEVVLPVDNPGFWQTTSNERIFDVTVSAPNGGIDEYAFNDSYASEFEPWDTYTGDLSLRWRTNNKPGENRWRVYDETGAIVLQSSPFLVANTVYIEEFNLPMGCYTLEFTDLGDDGLYYWALSSQGTGFVQFREQGNVQKVFEPEFGAFFQYDFWTDGIVGDVDVQHPEYVRISPNPSSGTFALELQGWDNQMLNVQVFDLLGKSILQTNFNSGQGYVREAIDLDFAKNGTYYIKIDDGSRVIVKRVVKQ